MAKPSNGLEGEEEKPHQEAREGLQEERQLEREVNEEAEESDNEDEEEDEEPLSARDEDEEESKSSSEALRGLTFSLLSSSSFSGGRWLVNLRPLFFLLSFLFFFFSPSLDSLEDALENRGQGSRAPHGQRSLLRDSVETTLLASRLEALNIELLRDARVSKFFEKSKDDSEWKWWGMLVTDYDSFVKKNTKAVVEKVRRGVPRHLRGLVWQKLCSSNAKELEEVFKELIQVNPSLLVLSSLDPVGKPLCMVLVPVLL